MVANAITAVIASVGTFWFAITDAVSISIIGGIVTVITSLAAAYFSYRAKQISQETKAVSQETGKAVNGKMEKMLEIGKSLAREEGKAEGKAEAETKAAVIVIAKEVGKAEAIKEQVDGQTK